jgi:PAS domain S-box-containing protein
MESGRARDFLRAMYEPDALLVARWQERVRDGGAPSEVRFRLRTPRGLRRVLARAERVGERIDGACIDLGPADPESDAEVEESLRAALDRVRDAFTVHRAVRDAHGDVIDFEWVYANAEAARILGYPQDDLVGARLLDLLPGNRHDLFPAYRRVVEIGIPYHAELVYEHDGIRGWFENHTVRVGDGIAVWFRDVTERREAEEERRRAEQRFRTVFEAARSAIVLTTPENTYLDANPAFCALLGVDREEIVGRSVAAFVPDELRARALEIRAALVETGSWTGEFPLRRPDGSIVELRWKAVQLANGRMAMIDDIAEEKATARHREEALALEREARMLAETEARRRDEFIAIVSHELRSPLHAVLGWSSLLAETVDPPESLLRKGLDAIQRNAELQARMLQDLIDLARLDRGMLAIEHAHVSWSELVRRDLESFAPQAERAGVSLVVEDRAPHAWVRGDAARLTQVTTNLVSNALKFSPRASTVRVSMDARDDRLELVVEDRGPGIPRDMLGAIFERFRQVDGSSKRRSAGLGLGLAIVQQIVRMHRGRVWAESDGPGTGSRFVVSLPVADEPGGESVDALEAAVDLTGVPILVIDDSADSREVLLLMLRQLGATVLEAERGLAGLALLAAHRPAVVLCDISMPEMDGFEVIESIRAHRDHAHTPVIAVTALSRNRDRILRAGFSDHVPKPVDVAELRRALQRALARDTGKRRALQRRAP